MPIPEEGRDGPDVGIPEGFVFVHKLQPVFSDVVQVLNADVKVVNNTNAVVHFEKVQSSCACSGADLEKNVLGPGERTILHVSADLKNRTGFQSFVVNLIEPSGRLWVHRVEVNIYERVKIDAFNQSLHLGNFNPEEESIKEVALLLCSSDERTFPTDVLLHSDLPGLEYSILPDTTTERLEDGCWVRKAKIRFSHRAPKAQGSYSGTVTVRYKFEGEEREAKLRLTGFVVSLFEVVPQYVVLGRDHSEKGGQRISIRRTDGKPVEIERCDVGSDGVTATLEKVGPEVTKILVITYDPEKLREHAWGELTLKVNHELQPILKIPFAILVQEGGKQ